MNNIVDESEIDFNVQLNDLCIRYMYVKISMEKIESDDFIESDVKVTLLDNLQKEIDFLRSSFYKYPK